MFPREKKKKSVPGCRNWILLKASLEQMLILYFLHQFKKKKKKDKERKKEKKKVDVFLCKKICFHLV